MVGAVTCVLDGSGNFVDTTNANQGLASLSPRTVNVSASSTGDCLDIRADKSATGGRSIVKRSVIATGTMSNSTCVLANGSLTIQVTWTLDDNSTISSSNTLNITGGNFLQPVPGTGSILSGLLSGLTVSTNMVLTDAAANAAACGTSTGLTNYGYTIETIVLQ
ncbi:hypothetical protein [Streptomyces sp. NPDC002537]